MGAPREQGEISFVWRDVSVEIPSRSDNAVGRLWRRISGHRQDEKTVPLTGASGFAVAGNMIAIMGPSGAGKTTLLAALAGGVKLTSGSVLANGLAVSAGIMSEISSYLPQFEALPPYLTPTEHMLFTCALKMESTITPEQRDRRSQSLLIELGLRDCKDTLISGLSGGQRRRLSLATELITKPKILFLDEPTTGLDTFAAAQVMQSIRLVTLHGTIVFCTIHQPGMAIYNMFSHVLLVAHGRTAFFGTRDNAVEFFESQGFERPAGFDESEYYVNLLSRQRPRATDASSEKEAALLPDYANAICDAFSRSPLSEIPAVKDRAPFADEPRGRRPGYVLQSGWLIWRICKQNRRAFSTERVEWVSYTLSVIMIASFYAGLNPHTQTGVQSARGALYMMTSEIAFTVTYSVIYAMPGELVIYLRERRAYGPAAYCTATIIGLVPKTVTKALIFTVTIYLVVSPDARMSSFLLFCICTTATAICAAAYGTMISGWIDDIDIATTVMVPIDMMFLLTAGMFYNIRVLPAYLASLKYTSVFYYANEMISVAYWSQIDNIECGPNSDAPCLSNGTEVLAEYGYARVNFWWDLGCLTILTIVMDLVGYIGIRRRRTTRCIY